MNLFPFSVCSEEPIQKYVICLYHPLKINYKAEDGNMGLMCLGPVKPRDENEMLQLRRFGIFSRDWWQSDQLPPNLKIPKYCFNRHGFIMNRNMARKIYEEISNARTLDFRNDDIFITGIMRLAVITKYSA